MAKIMLDPGHGGTDPGAQGNGLVEKTLALDIASKSGQVLQDQYADVSIHYTRTADKNVSLSERSNRANQWGADLFVSFHHNAGGGSGFESYTYLYAPQRTKVFQEKIHNQVMSFLSAKNIPNRGRKLANFAVLRETTMASVLLENLFLDNLGDARYLQESAFRTQLAMHIAQGIAEALQLTPVPASPPPSRPTTGLYRVQVGSFSVRENAEALVQRLQQKGFQGAMTYDDGLYKVQAGAFAEKQNAENLAVRLRQAGFETYIYRVS